MDLTSQRFWDRFYEQNPDNEWYFDQDYLREQVKRYLSPKERNTDDQDIVDFKVNLALNCGCGPACERVIDSNMRPNSATIWSNFDYAGTAFQSNLYESTEALIADALHMPYRSSIFDLIIEKGLFDSVTSRDTGDRCARAHRLLDEYERVLSNDGYIMIFSLFGPNAEAKDMFGLLSHECFTVECISLYVTPAEIPDQDFCFLYVLQKKLL